MAAVGTILQETERSHEGLHAREAIKYKLPIEMESVPGGLGCACAYFGGGVEAPGKRQTGNSFCVGVLLHVNITEPAKRVCMYTKLTVA